MITLDNRGGSPGPFEHRKTEASAPGYQVLSLLVHRFPMLFLFVQRLHAWLEAHHLGFLRVFNAVEFQATAAVVLSFLICIILGPRVIAWLRKQKIGDNPDFDQADINKMMEGKKGTPTMGGVLIIASIFTTVMLLADLSNFYVGMALVCVVLL